MPNTPLQKKVSEAIEHLGVAETSRRLETDDETTMRLALPGARVRRGSVALAETNLYRLARLPAAGVNSKSQ